MEGRAKYYQLVNLQNPSDILDKISRNQPSID